MSPLATRSSHESPGEQEQFGGARIQAGQVEKRVLQDLRGRYQVKTKRPDSPKTKTMRGGDPHNQDFQG